MIIRIFKTFHSIWRHPAVRENKARAIWRYVTWQIVSRLNFNEVIFNWIDDAVLVMKRSEAMVTHNYYTGLYEFEDMHFLMRYVSGPDSFVDVGANSGVYTILAGKVLDIPTVSIEPIKSSFARLLQNVKINKIEDRVILCNIGLSNQRGTLKFTSILDATNHVSIKQDESVLGEEIVKVDTIDNLLASINFKPTILKIDVEGFEKNVLSGAHTLLQSQTLRAILIELNDSGVKYGISDEDVASLIIQNGFLACDYDVVESKLFKIPTFRSARQNTIFVRDIQEVNFRLKEVKDQKMIKVLNKSI